MGEWEDEVVKWGMRCGVKVRGEQLAKWCARAREEKKKREV